MAFPLDIESSIYTRPLSRYKRLNIHLIVGTGYRWRDACDQATVFDCIGHINKMYWSYNFRWLLGGSSIWSWLPLSFHSSLYKRPRELFLSIYLFALVSISYMIRFIVNLYSYSVHEYNPFSCIRYIYIYIYLYFTDTKRLAKLFFQFTTHVLLLICGQSRITCCNVYKK